MPQYTIGGTIPRQIVFAPPPGTRPVPQTIYNRDPSFTLLVGCEMDHQQPDFTSLEVIDQVDPLASVTLDGSQNCWALLSDPAKTGATIQVDVYKSSISQVGSPLAIAGAIATGGIAVAIAQAIAASGVSLLASPTPLYGGSIAPPPAGASICGATVGYNLYGGSANANDEKTAITTVDGYMGRPEGTLGQKIYLNDGQVLTTPLRGDYLQIISYGAGIFVSIKPWYVTGTNPTYSNTTVTAGGTTCLTELNNITTTLTTLYNAFVAAGKTPLIKATLAQEPMGDKNFPNPAAYLAYFQYYQTAIAAFASTTVPRVYNPSSGKGEAAQAAWYPGDSYVDEIMVDFYGDDYNAGTTLATAENLADSHSPSPIPFGLGEWNAAASPKTTLATAQGYWPAYWNYILSVFSARLGASKTNTWILLYMGFNVSGTGGGKNLIPDQITSIADYKIAGIQAIYDALSSSSLSSSPTIAAGASYIVTPINPTTGGKFAAAGGFSYDVSLSLQAGLGSTSPFATVSLEWLNQDSASAQPVAKQFWSVPMGAAAGTVITGLGPQHAQFLRVHVTNKDSVTCTLVNFMLNSAGRAEARHNWQWDAPGSTALPSYSPTDGSTFQGLAGGQSFGGALGALSSVTVGAGAELSWLFSVFAGQVYFRFNAGSSGKMTVTVHPQPGGVWGSTALLNETPTGEFEDILIFPRAPVLVTISNTDSASHNADVEIIALDPA